MSTGCQKDRNTGRQTDRQTDRKTDRIQKGFSALQLSKQKLLRMSTGCQKDRNRQTDRQKAFQLSYQNKSCSECQQDVRKTDRQTKTCRQTDRKTDTKYYLPRDPTKM